AVSDLAQIPSSLRIDAIVNLAGAGVANALWTRARKATLVSSRIKTTEAIGELVGRLAIKPNVLVNASAVGFYGDQGDRPLTENAAAGHGFASQLCTEWEAAAGRAGQGVRLVCLRFGVVIGRDGGAWPRLTLPLNFGVGAIFGSGSQWMAWIHKEDA